MKNKKTSKKKGAKTAHFLVMYVDGGSPKIKRLFSGPEVSKFISDFQKINPDYMNPDSDYWIDYVVTGVTGDVHFFTDGMKVE